MKQIIPPIQPPPEDGMPEEPDYSLSRSKLTLQAEIDTALVVKEDGSIWVYEHCDIIDALFTLAERLKALEELMR